MRDHKMFVQHSDKKTAQLCQRGPTPAGRRQTLIGGGGGGGGGASYVFKVIKLLILSW